MTNSEPRPAFGSVENYAAIIRGIAQGRHETYVCATALSSNIADGGGGVTTDADRLQHIRNIFSAAEVVRDELRRQQDTTATRPRAGRCCDQYGIGDHDSTEHAGGDVR